MSDLFEMTESHLKLLAKMHVGWNESYCDGAPEIDPKRPYGNSAVPYDVYEIIHGHEWSYVNGDEMPHDTIVEMLKVHNETERALQIALCTQSFEVGTYEKQEKYSRISWRKIS